MDSQLAVVERRVMDLQETAMTVDSVVGQVQLIQQVMERVMVKDEHYGTIPGCPKPSLYKPGAEKLSLTFRLAPYYDGEREPINLAREHREFIIKCTLKNIMTDKVFGQGVGSCSTMEAKYRFRNSERKCPKCGKETIIKGKEEYGGGWLCYAKKGGCGAKFKDKDQAIEGQTPGRVEHDNPADYYNTVLKMAKKRAHVDAVLTATAASDIFTQDVEDMVENGEIPKEKPQSKVDPKHEKFHEEQNVREEKSLPILGTTFKDWLNAAGMAKDALHTDQGDHIYYGILGEYKHANKVTNRKEQERILGEWVKAIEGLKAASEVFQTTQE